MAGAKNDHVTMRIRIGDSEFEVTGPQDFVEAKISEYADKIKELTPLSPVTSPTLTNAEFPLAADQIKHKMESEAQFFRKISPRTDVDRTLAAGYYLEKIQGQESFTAAEIKDVIKQAKIPPPKNPSDTISKNIRKGFIMSSGDKDGRMAFVLTSDGEDALVNMIAL